MDNFVAGLRKCIRDHELESDLSNDLFKSAAGYKFLKEVLVRERSVYEFHLNTRALLTLQIQLIKDVIGVTQGDALYHQELILTKVKRDQNEKSLNTQLNRLDGDYRYTDAIELINRYETYITKTNELTKTLLTELKGVLKNG